MMTNAWVIILCFFRVAPGTNKIINIAGSGREGDGGRHKGELKVREACSSPGKSTPTEPKGLWVVIWNLPFLTLSGCERK